MVNLRFILYVNSILLIMLAGAMMLPALADLAVRNPDGWVFVASSATTLFFGGMFYLGNRGEFPAIGRRTAFALTVSCWLFIGAFSTLPLAFSPLDLSLVDAYFETMSGLTTTGSTVIVGLDSLPPGLLLWRSLLQWLGGVGIVVMAIFMLPLLRVGGMQLFRSESSEIAEKLVPRVIQMASLTVFTYALLTFLCTLAYMAAGMPFFEAINHAMTTLATGGYSTKDASIGFFDSVAVEVVAIVFMIAGALPLIFYPSLVLQGRRAWQREPQVRWYLGITVVAIALCFAWLWLSLEKPAGEALRLSAFNVVSIITDTGYATADFSAWGAFPVGLFFMLYFIGGCAGSTAGAIKIFRWKLLLGSIARQLQMMLSPNRVLNLRYAGKVVDGEMLGSVRNFFFLYILTFLVLSLAVMTTGLDFLSSTSSVAQAMANAGPGLGPVVGPATNFGSLTETAKLLLVLAMLLGRLELTTVYVLFIADFWRG